MTGEVQHPEQGRMVNWGGVDAAMIEGKFSKVKRPECGKHFFRLCLLHVLVQYSSARPHGMCYSLGPWGPVGARTPWGRRVVGNSSHQTHVAGSIPATATNS